MTKWASSRGLPCHARSMPYTFRIIPVRFHDTIQRTWRRLAQYVSCPVSIPRRSVADSSWVYGNTISQSWTHLGKILNLCPSEIFYTSLHSTIKSIEACPPRHHLRRVHQQHLSSRSHSSANMAFSLSPKTRLIITISISFAFFVAEITGSSTWCAKIYSSIPRD